MEMEKIPTAKVIGTSQRVERRMRWKRDETVDDDEEKQAWWREACIGIDPILHARGALRSSCPRGFDLCGGLVFFGLQYLAQVVMASGDSLQMGESDASSVMNFSGFD
jgi:hypothetical protein